MVTFLEIIWYFTLFVAATCWTLHYFIYMRQIAKWKESNIPFLRPMFLIGHEYLLNVGRKVSMIAALDQVYRENYHKNVVGFFMGTRPVIMVKDRKLIQELFAKNSDKTFCSMLVPLSDDIELQSTIPLSSDKAHWNAGRSALAPMFKPFKMGADFDKFEKQMERVLDFAEKARCLGQPLQIPKIARSFVSDSTLSWHFDKDTNSLVEPSTVYNAVHEFFAGSIWGSLKFYLVILYPALQKIGFGKRKPFRLYSQMYFDITNSLLKKRRDNLIKHGRQDKFVDHLVSLKDKRAFAKQNGMRGLDPEYQNDRIVRQMTGYAWTMLMAGLDAPSQVSIFTIHLLSLHPECQDKIKREIDQIMENHKASKLTFEVIQDLRYTTQCVYEATRLIPNLAFLVRRCSDDIQLPGTAYSFRKGDMLIFCQYSLNHDPKYFENPNTFDPERFNSVENWSSFTSDILLSFGAGPRKCPGYSIGVIMIVMLVATLLSKYRLKPLSHLKQMTTPADFNPRSISNTIKGELLVDLISR